ncbi:MAG: DNA recombination protein RmuC [Rickettsiales bacterium]|nr:MAG: DNA recombination protein RmuC [Rickettsiales bacterium]
MFYIPIISSAILAVILLYFIYSNVTLRAKMKFLEQVTAESSLKNTELESEKIRHIQKIEQLSGSLEHQKQFIADFEKLRAESHNSTKAALFEMGGELSKQLIDMHKKESKEHREVSDKSVKDASVKFNSEFERIVNMVGALSKEVSQSKDTVDVIKNSLLSPSGAGCLAEITLENILNASGLRKSLDFIMQYSVVGEEKEILRPDAVVFLPSDKLMIIDAKASKFLVDDQGDLKNLARTMNLHLRSLSSKSYSEVVQKSLKKNRIAVGNVVTLMFLPSEHAIEKLIEADTEFMTKAWKSNIFPVGPAGLMNMLSFAKFQISETMMAHNHQQIIDEVKKLIASIGSMAEHSMRLGGSISSLVSHYDKFAASFNRNFLSKARNIGKMGIEEALKKQNSLQRMQLVASQPELIEIEAENEIGSEVGKIEEKLREQA